MHNRKPTYVQEEVYQHLRDLSRFYRRPPTEDLNIKTVTQGPTNFPELENSYPHQLN